MAFETSNSRGHMVVRPNTAVVPSVAAATPRSKARNSGTDLRNTGQFFFSVIHFQEVICTAVCASRTLREHSSAAYVDTMGVYSQKIRASRRPIYGGCVRVLTQKVRLCFQQQTAFRRATMLRLASSSSTTASAALRSKPWLVYFSLA